MTILSEAKSSTQKTKGIFAPQTYHGAGSSLVEISMTVYVCMYIYIYSVCVCVSAVVETHCLPLAPHKRVSLLSRPYRHTLTHGFVPMKIGKEEDGKRKGRGKEEKK